MMCMMTGDGWKIDMYVAMVVTIVASADKQKTVEPVYMSEAVCATTDTDYCVMGAGAKGGNHGT